MMNREVRGYEKDLQGETRVKSIQSGWSGADAYITSISTNK